MRAAAGCKGSLLLLLQPANSSINCSSAAVWRLVRSMLQVGGSCQQQYSSRTAEQGPACSIHCIRPACLYQEHIEAMYERTTH